MRIDSSGDIKFSSTQGTTLQFDRIDTTVIANEVIGKLDFKSTDSGDTGVNASIKVIKQDLAVGTVPMAITFETGVSGTIAERMRIDSSGMVGIGIIPGNGFGLARLSLGTGALANEIIAFASASGGNAEFRNTSSTGTFTFTNADGASEKMRITSGGNLLVGRTTTAPSDNETGFRFDPTGEAFAFLDPAEGTNSWHVYDITNDLYRFFVSDEGKIHATFTSITAISDVTLKENIKPLETGLNEVMKLQPRRFDWKNGDGKNIAGFVAQEVEEILPDLVGDYKYNDKETKKSLMMGDMIPTLVKAIQELKAEVDLLKSSCNCK
jgi:hypothetical protein